MMTLSSRWFPSVVTALALAAPLGAAAAPQIAAPDGWTAKTVGPATVLTPGDLSGGQVYSVAVFPEESLGSRAPEDWLTARIAKDRPFPGVAPTSVRVKPPQEQVTSGSCFFPTGQGPVVAIYTAIQNDDGRVSLLRVLSSPDKALVQRYQEATGQLIAAYVKPHAAPTARRGVSPFIRPGGALVPGRYEFRQDSDSEYFHPVRQELQIYPSGEWRLVDHGQEVKSSGYTYKPSTGALDLDVVLELYNSDYDRGTFLLYGRDAQGKPVIYGEDDRGVSTTVTVARYLGPTNRPSPGQEKAAQERRDAEARRFHWVTAPGHGLRPGQIAAILHGGWNETTVGGMAFVEQVTLLLKDGTAYRGLRCSPADLDVAASRRHEPEQWGRWKRQGSGYLAAWNGSSEWASVPGTPVVLARRGERLSGTYSTSSAISIAGNVSTFHRSVTFRPDGTFETNHSSLFTSGIASNLTTGTAVSAYGDDEGGVVSAAPAAGAISPGRATVTAQSRRAKDKAARSGRYELDGCTLTLRYGNGTVTRLPFFFWDAEKDYLWFGDESIDRKNERGR